VQLIQDSTNYPTAVVTNT